MRKEYEIKLPRRVLRTGRRTLVMGILNVTPDSFSDGGLYFDKRAAVERALALEAEGADILDIGGESSRPNADPVSAEDEIARTAPVIEALIGKIKIPVSIDTYKSETAKAALAAGAEIINDISGLRFSPLLAETAAQTGAALCLMHMRGAPKTMQKLPPSADIWAEIENDLRASINRAAEAGVEQSRLIIDPGIGFGKTAEDNLKIIDELNRLEQFDLPILIGTSRKSFIGKILGRTESERLMGTAASVTASIMRGAHIIRVHDVAELRDAVKIADAILAANI